MQATTLLVLDLIACRKEFLQKPPWQQVSSPSAGTGFVLAADLQLSDAEDEEEEEEQADLSAWADRF